MTFVRTVAAVVILPFALAACEFAPKLSKQTGYRGTGTAQVSNVKLQLAADVIPPEPYPLEPDNGGPRAGQTYQNVQVLRDISTDEFNRLMLSMNDWIGTGEQGCNYCHNPENMASDEVYQKVVARRMLAMTRQINTRWASHVQETGVTCYTCHRGNPVPQNVWTLGRSTAQNAVLRGNKHGQNTPDPNVGYASLPFDPFASYLQGKTGEVRVAASSAYPSADWKPSIKEAEGSYGLMMHISSALGVNCTYCHNSQSFKSWGNSTQQRGTAFYGVRMVRDINESYITPLTAVFPANRLGPQGDPYKANCATCHQGKAKPLGGVSMLKDHPALGKRREQAVMIPTPSAPVALTPGETLPQPQVVAPVVTTQN